MSQEMGYHWGKADAAEILPKLQQANGDLPRSPDQ
jgi:hypothetical protein